MSKGFRSHHSILTTRIKLNRSNFSWIHKRGEDTWQTASPKTGDAGEHGKSGLNEQKLINRHQCWGRKTSTAIVELMELLQEQVWELKTPLGSSHGGMRYPPFLYFCDLPPRARLGFHSKHWMKISLCFQDGERKRSNFEIFQSTFSS